MFQNFDRRRFLSMAGATGVAGLTVGAVSTEPAAAAAVTPTGSWAVTVDFPTNPSGNETGLMAFTADGILIESNSGSRTAGLGTWRPNGLGFVFGWREQLFDANGTLGLVVHVAATGRFSGANKFTATGTGTAYDPSGTKVATIQSNITGTRYGIGG